MRRRDFRSFASGISGPLLCLGLLVACTPSLPGGQDEKPVMTPVPVDLDYLILNPSRPSGLRCSPDVSISYKVPRDVLESLTRSLLVADLRGCEFGVLTFYLPHMEPGTGAWAVAEIMEPPEAAILGLGALEEKDLVSAARRGGSTVGTWIDDTSYAAVISVVQKGEDLFVERHHRSGLVTREEVVFGRYDGRTGFERKEQNELGRYYVVNRRGYLETHDDHGRLSDARLFRLDRDIDRLVVDEQSRLRTRVRLAETRAEQARVSGNQRRLETWHAWLEVFRTSMEPVRHPLLRLTTLELEGERSEACRELSRRLAVVPESVRVTPSASIDLGGLELGLSRVASACEEERWVGVLIESRSVAAVWREFDRTLYLVAQQYRELESN